MWQEIDNQIERKLNLNIWSNVYGLGRSLIALSVLLTLLINDVSTLFRPILGVDDIPMCNGLSGKISLFCLLSNNLELARWISIIILFVVTIGWRPRIMGVLHWWINYSLISSAPLVDGGEHAATVISFLLIPITLTDSRLWHWDTAENVDGSAKYRYKNLVASIFYDLIRIQVAVIYLHSAVGKCSVLEWQNGTALYYWFTDPMFGMANWLKPIVLPLLQNPLSLTIINWWVIILEFLLFAGLFMSKSNRGTVLFLGILFHVLIGFVHGLVSFALIMIGALILFLRPFEHDFSFKISKISVFRLFKFSNSQSLP